jgi:uncharacterized protein YdeI (YjbR/CyaY-like superfamily)
MGIKEVDSYILKNEKWAKELELLRQTAVTLGLKETLKWGAPVYTISGKNVIGLGAFKNHVGIWFFNGSLLKDSHYKLFNAQVGKTVAMRQWRFTNFESVVENVEVIELYIKEAMENTIQGKIVKTIKNKPLIIPVELQLELDSNQKNLISFNSMSVSKRREYANYIINAKRAITKQSRLEKILPMIQEGLGLNDKYKKQG